MAAVKLLKKLRGNPKQFELFSFALPLPSLFLFATDFHLNYITYIGELISGIKKSRKMFKNSFKLFFATF